MKTLRLITSVVCLAVASAQAGQPMLDRSTDNPGEFHHIRVNVTHNSANTGVIIVEVKALKE